MKPVHGSSDPDVQPDLPGPVDPDEPDLPGPDEPEEPGLPTRPDEPPPPIRAASRHSGEPRRSSEQLKENRERLGVDGDHRTYDMRRNNRGTFP